MLCDEEENTIVAISRDLVMFQFNFKQDGSTVIKTKAKLSVNGAILSSGKTLRDVVLTRGGQLVALTEVGTIQCWDLRNDESYSLEPLVQQGVEDTALSMAYSSDYGMLAIGTQCGKCIFWKECPPESDGSNHGDEKWLNVFYCDLTGYCRADAIHFGKTLLIQSSGNMLSMKQHWLHSTHKDGKAAVQIDEGTVVLFHDFQDKPFAILDTFMTVQGLAIDARYVCVWSLDNIQIYSVENTRCEMFSEISLRLQSLAIAGESLYIAQGRSLLVADLNGAQKLTIRFPEDEGCPQHLDTTSNRLAICTDNGTIKIMDITNKEPQLLYCHKKDILGLHDFPVHSILSIKSNADSTLLSIMSADPHDHGRCHLHFFQTKHGTLKSIDGAVGAHSVTWHCWDPAEPKIFACETRSKDHMIPRALTLFISDDTAILLHTNAPLDSWSSVVVGLSVPFLSTLRRNQEYRVVTRIPEHYLYCNEELIGFEGCINENPAFISAMADFSFYIASGDVDKAYICANPIKTHHVWKRLAKACIHSENLDVAKQCLTRMGHGNGIAAVREAEHNPEAEVALAEVAIQLGMTNDAERLYRKCQRFDLLCDLFRRQGLWQEAFEVAKNNTLLEKSLHYYYGSYLELNGELPLAVVHYEKSSLSKRTLLQTLIQHRMPVDNFLRRANDNALITWYASHIESLGDVPHAKLLYATADDTLNLVRLACAEGELEYAFELAKGGCKAGAYHLARHLEAEGDIAGALACYSLSGMYNYAIRLCKIHECFDELMDFALQSQAPQTLHCADYFLQKGELEKSARLFTKAGEKGKAIEIIIQIPFDEDNFHMHAEYASLIEELDIDVSKDTVQKCVQFLIKSGKTERALTMMKSKGFPIPDLLHLCLDHNITLDEDLASTILSEPHGKDELKAIADVCRQQGNYTLACKKFTQAGDKINAIKSLLKAGDANSIIAYASASRSNDVYILAANYLQTL